MDRGLEDETAYNNNSNSLPMTSVHVYCRLRPPTVLERSDCFSIISPTTIKVQMPVQLQTPRSIQREYEYSFKQIFSPETKQKEIYASVGRPLVKNLLLGHNGLLFTYGITGSGKTYTMTGNGQRIGLLQNCLAEIFENINNFQAQKYTFKSDGLNGFELRTDLEARREREREAKMRGIKPLWEQPHVGSDNICAVFITYIEFYNNSVYDLLESYSVTKPLQSHIIREDMQRNTMYVHGVTELEIKNVAEGIEIFHQAQKRKHMAHTLLNAESSRSHSSFNIRLVRAHKVRADAAKCRKDDFSNMTISQLCLVDLAGSERCTRTKNTGLRLREASNINNSLSTLRSCIVYLRENQMAPLGSVPKKIPYRDTKITHMFKNYFEGKGQVSALICINPCTQDISENLHVLKFAEASRELQISRLPITPRFKETESNCMLKIKPEQLTENKDMMYTLGPELPALETPSTNLQPFVDWLEQRIRKRQSLHEHLNVKCNQVHARIVELEEENIELFKELTAKKSLLKSEQLLIAALKREINIRDKQITQLNLRLLKRDREIAEIKQKSIAQYSIFKQKQDIEAAAVERLYDKFTSAIEEMRSEFAERIALMEEQILIRDEKLRLLSSLMKPENMVTLKNSLSDDQITLKSAAATTADETAFVGECMQYKSFSHLSDDTNNSDPKMQPNLSTIQEMSDESTVDTGNVNKTDTVDADSNVKINEVKTKEPKRRSSIGGAFNNFLSMTHDIAVQINKSVKEHMVKSPNAQDHQLKT